MLCYFRKGICLFLGIIIVIVSLAVMTPYKSIMGKESLDEDLFYDYLYFKENNELPPTLSALSDIKFDEIGRAINIISSENGNPNDVITSSSVFDEYWLKNVIISRQSIKNSVNYSYYGYSKEDYLTSMYSSYSSNLNLNGSYSYFEGTINSKFNTIWSQTSSKKLNSIFYTHEFESIQYRRFIDNFNTQIQHAKYDLQLIEELFLFHTQLPVSEYNLYSQYLLLKYGTHILTSGSYGGRLLLNYASRSENIDYKYMLSDKADTLLSASIKDDDNGKIISNQTFESELNKFSSSTNTSYYYSSKALGGMPLFLGTPESVNKNSLAWAESIVGDEVLIDYDQLVPIWDVLPSSITYPNYGNFNINYIKNQLRNSYNLMLSSNNNLDEVNYNMGFFAATNYLEEKIITDQDYKSQNKYYTFELGETSVRNLINKGYNSISLKIDFMGKELNNGYQEFHLFKDKYFNYPISSISKYEMNGSSLQREYSDFSIRFDNINLINLASYNGLDNNLLFYMYLSANGTGKDDWMIKNPAVTYTLNR